MFCYLFYYFVVVVPVNWTCWVIRRRHQFICGEGAVDQTQILVGTNLAKVTTSWGTKAPIKSSYVIAVYSMISHTNKNDAMFLITCTHS